MEEQLENQETDNQGNLEAPKKATRTKKTVAANESQQPEADTANTLAITEDTAEKPAKRPRKAKVSDEVQAKTDDVEVSGVKIVQQTEVLAALEAEIEEHHHSSTDYSAYTIHELNEILTTSLSNITGADVNSAQYRKADLQLKEIKPSFDKLRDNAKKEELNKYIADNETEDGFEWKEPSEYIKFEQLYKQIKELKGKYFNDLEKNKEKNFQTKTEIINQLRLLADSEDNSLGSVKENLTKIRKLQQEWKEAGNVASPHNNTLWQTFHALIDRFYSNRGIYFELLDLDRKKNLNNKIEFCQKVEQLSESAKNEGLTTKMLQEANHIFEEYKHIGPASREANEIVWQRFKTALDSLYDMRRSQLEELKEGFEQNYEAKLQVFESLGLFTSFKSESINDWLDQTKAIDILQQQWNAIKGPMPKDKGRDLSRDFWAGVKVFYKNKGEFFKALEAKRSDNLKQKTELCEQAEAILTSEDDSQASTQAIIKLQEDWRKIGHVPDKFRNKIYDRFKKTCDEYFNRKRNKNTEAEQGFADNLKQKEALCQQIETAAKAEGANIDDMKAFKAQWVTIGFVPKGAMQAIQKRYIAAINAYVSALGKLSPSEKEALSLQAEVELVKQGGDKNAGRDLGKKENEIRSKITHLENDLATLKNNLEFFAKSKNADKLKADFEHKIKRSEDEIKDLKHRLKVIRTAEVR
jgi:hypothetical protein